MIQSIMLAALGFVAASLLAVLVAPAFWARAVRLTNHRLRSALPVSEQEIRADKDLMRAEYALKVHQLERDLEQGQLNAHRQQIEINRRDIELRRLSQSLGLSETSLGEHRNARSVLEQTVTERIPQLETSLAQARDLLQARDSAIDDLQATADRQAAALEDGRTILTQRALEVQRLQALFQEASAQGRDMRGEGAGDGLALRAEVESLKARLAERAAVIDRLQSEVAARPRTATATNLSLNLPEDAAPSQLRAYITEQAIEIAQLRQDQTARPASLASSVLPPEDRELAARHLQDIETQLRAQTDEIDGLRAENEAFANSSDPLANAKVRESKIWLRSRIDRIEGDLERERGINGRLRAEIAAANERMARQSVQFRDEFRRQSGRVAVQARDILDGQVKLPVAATAKAAAKVEAEPAVARRPTISSRARELQRALQGQFGQAKSEEAAQQPGNAEAPPAAEASIVVPAANNDASPGVATPDEQAADGSSRGRLLDRLKSYEQA